HLDEDGRRVAHTQLARAVGRVVAHHGGMDPAGGLPRPAQIEAAGPPDASYQETVAAESLATIERMFAVADGVVLAFPRLLVWLGAEGVVRRAEPSVGQLQHAGDHAVMVESPGGDMHVLDLRSGAWQRGAVDPSRWFGGPLLVPPDLRPLFASDDRC